jgi:hypothetical protein
VFVIARAIRPTIRERFPAADFRDNWAGFGLMSVSRRLRSGITRTHDGGILGFPRCVLGEMCGHFFANCLILRKCLAGIPHSLNTCRIKTRAYNHEIVVHYIAAINAVARFRVSNFAQSPSIER